jgi:signal transduction histidine kinase
MEPVDPRDKELKALTRALARERERSELLETISRRQSDVAARIRSDLEVQLLAKATFMATMSHEIRTPIHGVMGMLQLLETTNPTQEQEEFLSAARGAAETLLTIINDVLDYSKLDLSRVELESTPFTLEDVVDAACGSLGPRAAQAGVRLYLLVDGGLPRRVEGKPSSCASTCRTRASASPPRTPSGCSSPSCRPRPAFIAASAARGWG